MIAAPLAGATRAVAQTAATDATLAQVAQVKDDLFAGTEKFAKGATDVSEINLDPSMMGMIGGHGAASGAPAAQLAHRMKFIVIHSYTYDKAGMYSMDDVEGYRRKLEDGTWNCAVHVKDKDGTTDICTREAADHESSEMVILAAEPKELTFIHMSGRMSLDDLGKMGGGMGMKGKTLQPRQVQPPVVPKTPVPPATAMPPS
jgi:hypothetical protein